MDTSKWAALLRAVELGSLTKTAQELGMTQSGMTHMMHALEAETGLVLLLRGRSGVRLTPEGQRLLPAIKALVQASDALSDELDHIRGRQSSTLRVGAYSSMAQHWLPQMLQTFRQHFPDAEVSVSTDTIEGNYRSIREGLLDCALVSRQASLAAGLEWVPLRNDELVAVLPAEQPVNGALFPLDAFDGREFLMPSMGFDLDIQPAFDARGVHPRIRRTNFDDASIVSMVEHGLGVSIMSELVMRGRTDRVKALPLRPPAYRELGIIYPPARAGERLLTGFISCAQDTVMEMYRS